MDKLDRRIIQLKIEREAVIKDTDEGPLSVVCRPSMTRWKKLQREYNDYEEIWKAEKAAVQGSQVVKRNRESSCRNAELQRQGPVR
jgi:ATP-dependent Clp protease ATP-binding subunit ClpB